MFKIWLYYLFLAHSDVQKQSQSDVQKQSGSTVILDQVILKKMMFFQVWIKILMYTIFTRDYDFVKCTYMPINWLLHAYWQYIYIYWCKRIVIKAKP